jgi:hypothetical protein
MEKTPKQLTNEELVERIQGFTDEDLHVSDLAIISYNGLISELRRRRIAEQIED